MKKPITRIDIKAALRDHRFRAMLPEELKEEVNKFLNNQSCPCNTPLYDKIAKQCIKQLQEYYPNREVWNPDEEINKLAENHWVVINCNINDLEKELLKLPKGRKQIAMSRFEDQITVIVNELDYVF